MAHRTTWLAVSLASALSVVGSASAQSYRDLTLVRNREQPYRSLLQFRGGWTGVEAEGDTVEDGHAAQDTLAGFVYYHSKDVTRARD